MILRGSMDHGPNYQETMVQEAIDGLVRRGLRPQLMIDCSHGNSERNYLKQLKVIESLSERIPAEKAIFGLMIESYLKPGSQKLMAPSHLEYGVSITDPCIGWEDTVKSLNQLVERLN
jgi:3-deoxy-7-phosphoheptulonate synthase